MVCKECFSTRRRFVNGWSHFGVFELGGVRPASSEQRPGTLLSTPQRTAQPPPRTVWPNTGAVREGGTRSWGFVRAKLPSISYFPCPCLNAWHITERRKGTPTSSLQRCLLSELFTKSSQDLKPEKQPQRVYTESTAERDEGLAASCCVCAWKGGSPACSCHPDKFSPRY